MGEFDKYNIHQIREIVSQDRIPAMRDQVEGWRALSYLLDSQYTRLTATTENLASVWRGKAGTEFLSQVDKVRVTLREARQVAETNMNSWNRVADQAEVAREEIYKIEREYAAFQEKRENTPQLPSFRVHYTPDAATLRKPFDKRAQAILEQTATTYSQEASLGLTPPPTYQGPSSYFDERNNMPHDRSSDNSSGLVSGAALASGAGLGATVSSSSGLTSGNPAGVNLAGGATSSTLIPPHVSAALAGPAGTPPIGASPGGMPAGLLPPGASMGPSRLPATGGPRSSIGGARTGSLGGQGFGHEPVIGSRGMPTHTSSTPGAVRGMSGGAVPPVIGSRGSSSGQMRNGATMPVRGSLAPGADGVVRPATRSAPLTGSGAMTGAGPTNRRRQQEQNMTESQVDESEIWEVDEGVNPVVQPPAVYDAGAEEPGPFWGRRRHQW